MRGGEYNADVIRPANSGTAGNEIVYIGYPGETAVITNANRAGNVAVVLSNRSYIHIINIVVNGKAGYLKSNTNHWAELYNTHHCVIEGSSFKYAKGWHGIELDNGSSFNKLTNNTFEECGAWADQNNDDYGDMVILKCAKYNLIQGNIFKRGGHNLIVIFGSYNIIKENIFDNLWGLMQW